MSQEPKELVGLAASTRHSAASGHCSKQLAASNLQHKLQQQQQQPFQQSNAGACQYIHWNFQSPIPMAICGDHSFAFNCRQRNDCNISRVSQLAPRRFAACPLDKFRQFIAGHISAYVHISERYIRLAGE